MAWWVAFSGKKDSIAIIVDSNFLNILRISGIYLFLHTRPMRINVETSTKSLISNSKIRG
jgi:hypothetical protein